MQLVDVDLRGPCRWWSWCLLDRGVDATGAPRRFASGAPLVSRLPAGSVAPRCCWGGTASVEVLGGVLATARGGDERGLALVGEPGIGKTALLDESRGALRACACSCARGRGVRGAGAVRRRCWSCCGPRSPCSSGCRRRRRRRWRRAGAAAGRGAGSVRRRRRDARACSPRRGGGAAGDARGRRAVAGRRERRGAALRRAPAPGRPDRRRARRARRRALAARRRGAASAPRWRGSIARVGGRSERLAAASADGVVERLYRAPAATRWRCWSCAADAPELAGRRAEAPLPVTARVAQRVRGRSRGARRGDRSGAPGGRRRGRRRRALLSRAAAHGWARPRRPRPRGASGVVAVGGGSSPSATRSCARRCTRPPPPASGARRTAPSPACCPTATPTAAPGTSRPRPRARTTRRRRRWRGGRPAPARASAYAVAASAYERAARLASDDGRRAGLLHEAATPPGRPGWRSARRRCSEEAARRRGPAALRGGRPPARPRRGAARPGSRGRRAARRRGGAWPSPARAVAILAEASNACYYGEDMARMLATAERAASSAGGRRGRGRASSPPWRTAWRWCFRRRRGGRHEEIPAALALVEVEPACATIRPLPGW